MIIDFWLKWPLRFSARLLNFRFVHLNKRKTEKHKMNSSLGIEKKIEPFRVTIRELDMKRLSYTFGGRKSRYKTVAQNDLLSTIFRGRTLFW